MAQMNMVQAINDALRFEMKKDDRVVILGEDVGKVGGVFPVTQGLFDEFGDDRVIDTPLSEGGILGGHYHSQSPEAQFIHVAGLKVVCPSNPADAKGLLLASIRDPDPVMFFEPKRIYRAAKGDVPEGDYMVPLGKAAVVREGQHVTIVVWGAMLYESLDAANRA